MAKALPPLFSASLILAAVFLAAPALHAQPFDMTALKPAWKKRLSDTAARGRLPILDLESSYDPDSADRLMKYWATMMDKNGIALIAFSPLSPKPHRSPVLADPARYIPVSPETTYSFSRDPLKCIEAQIAWTRRDRLPLMAEFYFRHYPSIRQARGADPIRKDIDIPIDGAAGRRLFAFSQESGIPFLIHYDIEDRLLPPLERMLKAYPGAKVVWCHLAQVRYAQRAKRYGPAYVRGLIDRFPNIHFDVAFSEPEVVYVPSGERQARAWDQRTGHLAAEWARLVADHPWRFHAALDLSSDRMETFAVRAKRLRRVLDDLPERVRPIVAYRSSWKLLFGEDISLGEGL